MRALRFIFLICLGLWQCSIVGFGGEYHLNNGDIIRGEPVSFNDDGMVVRLTIGGHSPRVSWSKFTQETLQELAQNPQAVKFVEPFIEVPPAPKDKEKKKREFLLKPVPRVERVDRPNFFASFGTPAGLAIVLVLVLANVYASYHVARYRHRPIGLVCGLAVVFPVLAPALFLAMPTAEVPEEDTAAMAEPAAAGPTTGKATTGSLAKTPMASGLSIAGGGEKHAAAHGPQIYKRGEFTFNRRFMETKFSGFFRVVLSEADKDNVILVRTAKEEFVAKRISRISSNEMHLQLISGKEVSVAFADIAEMQLRQKDAKA